MPLRYYPLAAIQENKYTRGNQFILPDKTPYTGRYYTLYDGKSYTGINPVLGTNILLTPVEEPKTTDSSLLIPGRPLRPGQKLDIVGPYATSKLNNGEDSALVLTELQPYFPSPQESDYVRGYFTRYFAKAVSGPGYIFEISKLDWTKIQNGDFQAENILGYESIDMLWQLTGPLNDTRVSQYQIKGGVATTNKRVTETKNKVFNGLFDYIGGDYTKFARITP